MPLARLLVTVAALLLPGLAAAQPGYFRVTGVAADDTLNVRAEPAASSADIGDLPPDARGIEVAGTDASGKWGQIVWEEANGWISMRFLAPDPVQKIPGSELPAGLLCGGTEPFWSMRYSPGSGAYSDLDGANLLLPLRVAQGARARGPYPTHLEHGGPGTTIHALIAPRACSDGMSDRTYPWHVDLLVSSGGTTTYIEGCCNLPLEVGFH